MSKEFLIYTDGACIGNGKPKNIGGWSFIVTKNDELIYQEVELESNTTNNRQEITAVLNAINYCKKNNFTSFTIFSDSQYVVNGFNSWMHSWRKKGWVKGVDRIPTPNADLWKHLYATIADIKVELVWVRGHNGNKWNEYADELINERMSKYPSYAH